MDGFRTRHTVPEGVHRSGMINRINTWRRDAQQRKTVEGHSQLLAGVARIQLATTVFGTRGMERLFVWSLIGQSQETVVALGQIVDLHAAGVSAVVEHHAHIGHIIPFVGTDVVSVAVEHIECHAAHMVPEHVSALEVVVVLEADEDTAIGVIHVFLHHLTAREQCE